MKQYLIGLCCGGTMEDPHIHYENHEVIEAKTPEDAETIYNQKHNCSYYYASCRGEVINDHVQIPLADFLRA